MATATAHRPKGRATFQAQSPLRTEITRRVDAYFAESGLDEKGGSWIVLKSATIVLWAVLSYIGLVFLASSAWTALPLALSLGFALAAIGFNVMHDGGHGAGSHHPWVNKLLASSVDMIGGSSYFWNQKHNVLHHTYTNINGFDEDIDAQPFMRMARGQPRYWFHRFQNWYEMLIFFFFAPKWMLYDDWQVWATARIADHTIPRPRGWDAVQIVATKLFFYGWAIALPLALHSPLEVALGFFGVAYVVGATLGIVFQLAHTVENVEFFELPPEGERLERPFFEHQIATTANFATRNPFVTWYVGGLNYQVEHHLFPKVSHRHYPALAKIVEQVCRELGVAYHRNDTLLGALRAHFGYMKRLGRA